MFFYFVRFLNKIDMVIEVFSYTLSKMRDGKRSTLYLKFFFSMFKYYVIIELPRGDQYELLI